MCVSVCNLPSAEADVLSGKYRQSIVCRPYEIVLIKDNVALADRGTTRLILTVSFFFPVLRPSYLCSALPLS